MNHTSIRRRFGIALAVLSIAAATPYSALAAGNKGHHRQAVSAGTVSFGQEGGNIRPFEVTITSTGAVSATGPVTLASTDLHVSKYVNTGLIRLAQAEGFFSMSAFTACTGLNPDVASRYITIRTAGKSTKVSVHGNCSDAFNELFAVASASVGFSFGTH